MLHSFHMRACHSLGVPHTHTSTMVMVVRVSPNPSPQEASELKSVRACIRQLNFNQPPIEKWGGGTKEARAAQRT